MYYVRFIAVCFFFLLLKGASADAATLSIVPPSDTPTLAEDIVVGVFLDTDGELVNAVEGVVTFDSDRLTLEEVRDGDSVLTFWVEKPTLAKEGVRFSGMTPGGFKEEAAPLFFLAFKAREEGAVSFGIEKGNVFLNDGLGTRAALLTEGALVSIQKGVVSSRIVSTLEDDEIPENFMPVITRDPDVFDGDAFLVFEAEDKKSGIAYYAVREGLFSWYRIVESPYRLAHQGLDRKIYVKAVDKKGNERIAILPSLYPDNDMRIIRILAIVGAVVVCVVLFRQVFRGRSKKS